MSPRPFAAWTAAAAAVAAVFAGRGFFRVPPCDDAFIVLTAVRNAFAGVGAHLVPAHGDAVLSTLLWPLLVALPTGLGVDAVASLRAVGVAAELLLAVGVLLLGREVARSQTSEAWSWTVGAFAAVTLLTEPVLVLVDRGGMETALVLALIAAAALAYARGRTGTLAWCVALLPWARFDAALAAAVFAFAGWRAAAGAPRSRRWLALGVAAGAAAFIVQRLVFGVWLPDSVSAKLGAAAGSVAGAGAVALGFLQGAVGTSAYWLVRPGVHLLVLAPASAGAVRVAREPALRRKLAPLLAWTVAYLAAFVGSGNGYAANFPWYFAPPLLTLVVLAAAGLGPLPAAWRRRRARAEPAGDTTARTRAVAALAAAAPVLVALGVWLAAAPGIEAGLTRVRGSFVAYRERSYAATAIWLARYGPARSIASNEVGTLAWFSPPGTEIVDLIGLSRAPADRGRDWLEMVAARPPEAIVTRLDFRYRRRLEEKLPGAWVWVRAGALDVGLVPPLAARLAPHREELERIYAAVDLEHAPPPPPASGPG